MASHHPPCSTGTPLATLGFLPSLSNLLTGFFLPLGFFRHLGRPSGCPSPTKAVQSSAGSCCPGLRSPRQLADRPLHLPYTVSPWSKLRCVLFPAVLPPPPAPPLIAPAVGAQVLCVNGSLARGSLEPLRRQTLQFKWQHPTPCCACKLGRHRDQAAGAPTGSCILM